MQTLKSCSNYKEIKTLFVRSPLKCFAENKCLMIMHLFSFYALPPNKFASEFIGNCG